MRPLSNDAYIWQRRWNSRVVQAVHESASSIRTWRVLAAEVDAGGGWVNVSVNWDSLRTAGNPVVTVIRIHKLDAEIASQSAALLAHWKEEGLAISGIEIDYDCGKSQLVRYRDFLHLLRGQLKRQDKLSITALPSWINSRDLAAVLAEVDEAVLQVHSVMNARSGLFNPTVAKEWAQKWSQQSTKPFLIALPTYWSRVSWDEAGRVSAIESETPRLGTDTTSQELFIEPGEVSSLVASLKRNPPPHLTGIAWFRLPTSQDERAWNTQTWQAVMEGRTVPAAKPEVRVQAAAKGVRNVYLVNSGAIAGRLPGRISLSALGCEFADALPPYALEWQKDGFRFQLTSQDVLRAGQQRLVGWVRCTGKDVGANASY